MKKLGSRLTNTSYNNLIDYFLMAGFVAVTASAVMPELAESMQPIFSKIGSMMIDAFFFFFLSA